MSLAEESCVSHRWLITHTWALLWAGASAERNKICVCIDFFTFTTVLVASIDYVLGLKCPLLFLNHNHVGAKQRIWLPLMEAPNSRSPFFEGEGGLQFLSWAAKPVHGLCKQLSSSLLESLCLAADSTQTSQPRDVNSDLLPAPFPSSSAVGLARDKAALCCLWQSVTV